MKQVDDHRLMNSEMDYGRTEEFIDANDRIPSVVGQAEHRFMKMLRKD